MATDIKEAVRRAINELLSEEAEAVLEFICYLRWRWERVDQSWFWDEEWQTCYQEAKADLSEGRYYDFDSSEDLLPHLKN